MREDTITAIASALGSGGISIIRISGSNAFSIIDKIFSGKNKLSDCSSHTLHYGHIVDGNQLIDEVMVSIMRAPKSYTSEDTVEINCHGGVVVTKKVLDVIVQNGARIAEPGEFTKRAFLNGRIDLSQAEAVMDVINAKSDMALKSSISQLKGNVLNKIKEIRSSIISDIAYIEAALDDPEHISVEGFGSELLNRINICLGELKDLVDSSENGRILHEGIRTVIIGRPNAGKSSLMNLLLKEERAIVTDIEGTTRDTLEETIQLGEMVLNIIDTAGIRQAENIVEKMGIDRGKKFAEEADLILYVVDGSAQLNESDYEIIELIKGKKAIVLLNKCDLDTIVTKEVLAEKISADLIKISAKSGIGLEEVENKIREMFFSGLVKYNDQVYITNARHKEALQNGIESLNQVKQSILDEMPEDFYTIDLMHAYEVLGQIIGESVGDDLVNTIFSKFCMGK